MATEVFSIVGKIAIEGNKAVISGLKEIDGKAKEAAKGMEATGKKLKDIGGGLTDVGKTMSAAITAPAVAVGLFSAKAASDFESAFAGVRKTVDATEEQFDMLENGIRDMAKVMPQSAAEIAAVGEAAGQLGIETENILGFTKTMVQLGDATNLSSEEAATALARLANITGMPQTEFDKLGSTIVALGNNFATTESEITEMSMRLAGSGSQIGLTESQIMGLAASMSSVGINAEAGGSSMSTVMKKISVAVAEGGDTLNGFAKISGMSSKEFAKAFQDDPMSAITSFIGGLDEASNSGENMTLMLKDLGIKGIQETDTLARLAGAHEVLVDAQEVAAAGWEENTALAAEAEQRYQTFESQLQIFKNKITDVGITIGGVLLPILSKMIEQAQPVIDKITAMANAFQNASPTMQKIILAFVAIAAAIGPFLVIMGTLVNSVGGLLLAFTKLGPVISVLSGPVGIVVALLIGLGAALIYAYQKSEDFRNAVNTIFSTLGGLVSSALTAVAGYIRTIWGTISEWWKQDGQMILQALTNVFNFLLPIIQFVMQGIANTIQMYWGIAKTIFSGALTVIMGLVSAFGALFTGNWSKLWASVKQILFGAVQLIWGLIQLWFIGKVLAIVGAFIGRFLGFFRSMGSQAGGIISGMVSRVTGFISNMSSGITSRVSGIVTAVARFFGKMSTDVGLKFLSITNLAKTAFNNTKNAILNPIKEAVTLVKGQIDKIIGFFTGLKGKLKIPKFTLPQMPKFKLEWASKEFLGKTVKYPTGFDVKWYDKGGIFTGPSIIGVGERRNEAVIPIEELRGMIRDEAGGAGGVLTVNIPVYLDGREIARATAPHIDTELARRQQQDARMRGRRI